MNQRKGSQLSSCLLRIAETAEKRKERERDMYFSMWDDDRALFAIAYISIFLAFTTGLSINIRCLPLMRQAHLIVETISFPLQARRAGTHRSITLLVIQFAW